MITIRRLQVGEKDLFKQITPGDRFILGVSDTTPPDAKFERLLQITEMVNEREALPMKVG